MKKLITASLAAFGLMLVLSGNAFAGFSPGMTICHCPPGQKGTKCFEITVTSQGPYNGHFPHHAYDHEGACTAEELGTSSNSNGSSATEDKNIGSGTVDGFTVPKPGGANWKEK